jgi:predicted nucleic acid-binding Zn ribbon protein
VSGPPGRPRRRDGDPEHGADHITDIMDAALQRLGVRRQVRNVQLQQVFATVVGPAVAPMCQALSLDRGTLLVATRTGALAQQLQMEMPTVIAALNERLGGDQVQRLRFTAMG